MLSFICTALIIQWAISIIVRYFIYGNRHKKNVSKKSYFASSYYPEEINYLNCIKKPSEVSALGSDAMYAERAQFYFMPFGDQAQKVQKFIWKSKNESQTIH